MTEIYFVRHAQPDYTWEDDRSRPLTQEGCVDAKRVCEALADISLDVAVSSPYKRSIDTIKECAEMHRLDIKTDERLHERKKGKDGNVYGMFQKRWADFNYCEEGGECLASVQKRNIEAVWDILDNYRNKKIIVGTHGTALSTIINYFDRTYKCEGFLRMIDFMPYIVKISFEGRKYISREEVLIVKKEYIGKSRADKQ